MAASKDHANVAILPPIALALCLGAAWLADRVWPLPFVPSLWPRFWLGGALVMLGLLTELWAFVLFRRARTSILPIRPTSAIIEAGPYRYSRNPIYVGMFVILVGARSRSTPLAVRRAGCFLWRDPLGRGGARGSLSRPQVRRSLSGLRQAGQTVAVRRPVEQPPRAVPVWKSIDQRPALTAECCRASSTGSRASCCAAWRARATGAAGSSAA